MADGLTVDLSEVFELEAALAAAAAVMPLVRHVVSESALRIQADTRSQLTNHPTWPGIAETVTVDKAGSNATLAQANVGFEDRGQDWPAWIHEFGSVDRSPHPTLFPAATRELPLFEKALGEAVAKAVQASL